MRRYRFRLEPVLRVRRSEEERARAEVLAAQREAAAQADVLRACDAAYAQSRDDRGPRPAADFRLQQAHRSALASAVLEQRRRVATADDAVARARESLAAAAQRVGALERLDERQRAEHAARALREEELTVDDLVVARSGAVRR